MRRGHQNGPVEMAPDEYPNVTAATIKQLYGTAIRCGHPACAKPLFRVHDETGERILNSRVTHIHARRRGGPRWIPMDPEENRSHRNLFLACLEHADEVDNAALVDRYPADLLRDWKRQQIEEYEQTQRSWPLTDVEAREMAAATAAGPDMAAAALVGVARAISRFISRARDARELAAREIALWRRTFESARRRFLAWDSETGERIYAEPASIETERHRHAVRAALEAASAELAPLADEVKAELAAIRAVSVDLRPWCEAIDRSIGFAFEAATTWPAPPPFEDSREFEDSLAGLQRAADALSARWRGEDVSQPTLPPAHAEVQADEGPTPLHEHQVLLESARRYSRVRTLPYDGPLAIKVFDATEFAATIPPVPSLWPYALAATAGLVADIARNADDNEFRQLIDSYLGVPAVRGVYVARHLQKVAKDETRTALEDCAGVSVRGILDSIAWADPAAWHAAEAYAGDLLAVDAATSSPEHTLERLKSALDSNPAILLPLIRGCAEWIEHRDSGDWRLLGYSRRYSAFPAWFPTGAVVSAIRQELPHVTPVEEPRRPPAERTDEDLAAQIVYLAASGA